MVDHNWGHGLEISNYSGVVFRDNSDLDFAAMRQVDFNQRKVYRSVDICERLIEKQSELSKHRLKSVKCIIKEKFSMVAWDPFKGMGSVSNYFRTFLEGNM